MEIENLASPDDGVDGGMPITRRRRVAVIAIHGVADQKLGDTCQALAELLIAQTPNGFIYEPGVRQDEILRVKLLEPVQRTGTTPDGLRKQLRQSAGSDFLREGGTAAGKKRSLAQGAPLSKGAAFTDYMLAKAKRADTPIDTYTAPSVAMTRQRGTAADEVDIHEMY